MKEVEGREGGPTTTAWGGKWDRFVETGSNNQHTLMGGEPVWDRSDDEEDTGREGKDEEESEVIVVVVEVVVVVAVV